MKTKIAGPCRRCPDCGRAVAAGPFQPATPSASTWSRCGTCRTSTADDLAAHMLAVAGVEYPADDPTTRAALARVPWRAKAVVYGRALRAAERRADRAHPRRSEDDDDMRAKIIEQHLTGADLVGTPGQPWEHVDTRAIRKAVTEAHKAAEDAGRVRRCSAGPCGACGRRTSPSWPFTLPFDPGPGRRQQRWALCGDCAPLATSAGMSLVSASARRRWTAAAMGKPADPPSMAVPALVRPYAAWADTDDPTKAPGVTDPWSWLPEENRIDLAERVPQLRPAEVLDREARARAAQARITRRATPARSALALEDDAR